MKMPDLKINYVILVMGTLLRINNFFFLSPLSHGYAFAAAPRIEGDLYLTAYCYFE